MISQEMIKSFLDILEGLTPPVSHSTFSELELQQFWTSSDLFEELLTQEGKFHQII